jgi:geranylgeranyl diphosphate synthase type II
MDFSAWQKAIEQELAKAGFDNAPQSLYKPTAYILSLGGKRLRPMLTLLACGLYAEAKTAMPQALAVEVFHNFSLMHDDILDQAPLRRGHQTVHEKWNLNTAILSGDVMLVKAYELLAKVDSKHLPALLALFNKTAIEVCEGQQMDMDFETMEAVSESEYIRMIQLKTSVLLGCALQMGAIVGGANQEDAQNLYQFGLLMGTSFQIKDDLLDCFGDAAKVGKQVGGDIIANKKTLLLIHALKNASGKEAEELQHWLTSTTYQPSEKVETVKAIYEKTGTVAYAEHQIKKYYNQAIAHVDALHVSTEKKQPLYEFASWLLSRQS